MAVLTDVYELNNGVNIPKIGFGTWQIPDGKVAYESTLTALKEGYRHIDTAKAYGNEVSVGRAIRDFGIARENVFVTSKLPSHIKDHDGVLKAFNETFSDLNIGYVDLYLIHAPWPWRNIGQKCDTENVEAWGAMEEIYKSGKARAIGVSNFNVHDLKNLMKNTKVTPAVDQIQYYVGFTEPKITAFAKAHNILIEAYSPLATGDVLHSTELTALADTYNVTVPQLALRYCLQAGVLPLPKATSQAHIAANKALDFMISTIDMERLNTCQDTAPSHFHNETQG